MSVVQRLECNRCFLIKDVWKRYDWISICNASIEVIKYEFLEDMPRQYVKKEERLDFCSWKCMKNYLTDKPK